MAGTGCSGRRRVERLAELKKGAAELGDACCWVGRVLCEAALSPEFRRRRFADVFGLVRVVVAGGGGGGVGFGEAVAGPSEEDGSGSVTAAGIAAKRSPKSVS